MSGRGQWRIGVTCEGIGWAACRRGGATVAMDSGGRRTIKKRRSDRAARNIGGRAKTSEIAGLPDEH